MPITNIINLLKTNLDQTDITLRKGASDKLISEVEHRIEVQLPDDIKEFYKFSNGFESAEDMFNIIPLEEVIEQVKNSAPNLYIAEYMIYGNVWEVKINPHNNNDYKILNIDEDKEEIILTNSFAEFIQHFLNGGVFEKDGLYDWKNKIKLTRLK
jgi:cell wall assembly regulator SMI1